MACEGTQHLVERCYDRAHIVPSMIWIVHLKFLGIMMLCLVCPNTDEYKMKYTHTDGEAVVVNYEVVAQPVIQRSLGAFAHASRAFPCPHQCMGRRRH